MEGSSRLQLWKECVRCKSGRRCYRVAQMTINIRYRVSYLTYVAITNHNKAAKSQAIEAIRVDDVAAHEEVARAKAHTKETNAQIT